ncbi:MAG: hypothetical protein QOC84_1899 [Bradyrhizobium sp.]|nr:hypothetical protein [Bradyrhizobium sp.]
MASNEKQRTRKILHPSETPAGYANPEPEHESSDHYRHVVDGSGSPCRATSSTRLRVLQGGHTTALKCSWGGNRSAISNVGRSSSQGLSNRARFRRKVAFPQALLLRRTRRYADRRPYYGTRVAHGFGCFLVGRHCGKERRYLAGLGYGTCASPSWSAPSGPYCVPRSRAYRVRHGVRFGGMLAFSVVDFFQRRGFQPGRRIPNPNGRGERRGRRAISLARRRRTDR